MEDCISDPPIFIDFIIRIVNSINTQTKIEYGILNRYLRLWSTPSSSLYHKEEYEGVKPQLFSA